MATTQQPADKRVQSQSVTANKTLTDVMSGYVQDISIDGVVITLPAAAAGKTVVLRAAGVKAGGTVGSGANKTIGFTVVGSVTGLGAVGALSCVKANMQAGDTVTLVGGAATWYVEQATGTAFQVV